MLFLVTTALEVPDQGAEAVDMGQLFGDPLEEGLKLWGGAWAGFVRGKAG